MVRRNLTLAFVSALIASGAWYYASGKGDAAAPATAASSSSSGETSAAATAAPPPPSASTSTTTTPARRALVLENGQIYQGTIEGDGPLQKRSNDSSRNVLEMLTPEQATAKLRRNEESYLVGRGNGVVRYDIVQVPSNNPIEDDHAEEIIQVSDDVERPRDWMFWGIFDGHSGWTTSAKLRQSLVSYVVKELNATYNAAAKGTSSPAPLSLPTPEAVDAAIRRGFVNLDNEIVHESVRKTLKANTKLAAAELLAPALAGSCALLAFYDTTSKHLKVAVTGDSRAVLGRRGAHGQWTATPLSEDQTGDTDSEVRRMQAEHPGEKYVIRNGRVLGGLQPTRAFGDAVYKWSRDTQARLKQSFFGRSANPLLRTPPYVTAEPVVTTTEVNPRDGDFLVMASDGLWEMLSNEEVVGLVGMWIDHENKKAGLGGAGAGAGDARSRSWLRSWFSSASSNSATLPVEMADGAAGDGQRAPIRQQQWAIAGTDRFVVEDANAATHLARNALGGKNRDTVCALLTLVSPYSRRYRDDLTIQVIFFGESPKHADITVNPGASASLAPPKASL